MKRFKNYGLWLALSALIGLILNDAGLVTPEKYSEYANYIFAVLIAAGIVNNPASGSGFKDENENGGGK
jgi:uncharacterized membrane protein